ncbi:MAG TPA: helix-turn-helix domain-containing protein [Streptosporangiaceae bacterium]|nr:helix-turn-helix domain-containing protein [Streptosporangiaceae bacterium]
MFSGIAFSSETAAVVRTSLGAAIPEMIEAIGQAVPEYARPSGTGRMRPDYQQRLADAVTGAVASFIARVAQPDRSMEPVLDEFRVIGGTAAREGRTLDGLQDALRLGARVAWRWLCEAGAGLDRRELSRVGEAVFGYLDELAAACARGYAEAGEQAAGDRQRRLLDLILADPPPRPEQVTALARAVGWVVPTQVAIAILITPPPANASPPGSSLPGSSLPGSSPVGSGPRRNGSAAPRPHGNGSAAPRPAANGQPRPTPETVLLPPGVLADWTAADPLLLIPDPDGPGRQAALDRALLGRALLGQPLGGRSAVIGPSVPLARAAQSLRWARHARALVQAGVISAANGPEGNVSVRCDQHLSTLLILADEDLAAALSVRRLAPLAQLRPGQRDRIAETLLAWLQLGENAAEVAQRIHVHPQTVRYRLRQITDLFGDQLRDPDTRFELQLALRIRTLKHS